MACIRTASAARSAASLQVVGDWLHRNLRCLGCLGISGGTETAALSNPQTKAAPGRKATAIFAEIAGTTWLDSSYV